MERHVLLVRPVSDHVRPLDAIGRVLELLAKVHNVRGAKFNLSFPETRARVL
jgi:hypothetical protein